MANLILGQDVANIAAHIPYRMRRYGSLINIKPSGSYYIRTYLYWVCSNDFASSFGSCRKVEINEERN